MAELYCCIYPSGYSLDGPEDARYGNEYTSLAAAIAGEVGGGGSYANGVLTDDLYIDILHGSGGNVWNGAPDTTSVVTDGFDCSTNSKTVYTRTLTAAQSANGVSSRPDFSNGTRDTTEYLLYSSGDVFKIDNDHDASESLTIVIEGLQFEAHTSGDAATLIETGAYHDSITFKKCWTLQNIDKDGLLVKCNNNSTVNVINCVFDGLNGTVTGDEGIVAVNTFNGTLNIYHCNSFGWNSNSIERDSGTVNCQNTISANSNDDFDGTFNTIDYCASDEGSGTNPIAASGGDWDNELTDAWVDLRSLNTGNIYLGSPINQNDDPLVPSDDIAGNPRLIGAGQSVTVGAYEYPVAPGGVAPTAALQGPLFGPLGGPI